MRIDELLVLMTERRSVRSFTDETIPDEDIRRLLEAARWAPSNSNRQGWKFLVVKSDAVKKKMAEAVGRKVAQIRSSLTHKDLIDALDGYAAYLTFFTGAPLVIVALSKRAPSFIERLSGSAATTISAGPLDAELMSVAMAIQNIQLAAHALGLGSCCMTGPCLAAAELHAILDVRAPFELAAIIPVGRYTQAPPAPVRKEITLISETIE